ncbi:NACHT domain-containing protein [Micromonospora arborensis]|uniref:NACHT domain-containing protein n=1 Tax=Micromonospora arborensis TaxID=2116518 RepID=UPI0011B4F5A7|nr:hypothetical protein [Micromonospora arborensis]
MRRDLMFTFQGALTVLGKHDRSGLDRLDTLLGGAIMASGLAVGGAALALVDPKNEAIKLLGRLLDRIDQKIVGTTGHTRHELIIAAHTILAVSSFFDALRYELGEDYPPLELTAGEMEDLTIPKPKGLGLQHLSLVEQLIDGQVESPSAVLGFKENSERNVRPYLAHLSRRTIRFLEGLAAWQSARQRLGDLDRRLAGQALGRYQDGYLRLAAEVPEFYMWATVGEHAATRFEVRGLRDDLRAIAMNHSQALSAVSGLLRIINTNDPPPATGQIFKLARSTKKVLERPLFTSDHSLSYAPLRFPRVVDGFVTPRFRLAVYTEGAQPAVEGWWARHPVRTDLDAFLSAQLASPTSTERPMLVLGHPGSGKSLLTEVLAARLPPNAYTTLRVPLRDVSSDAPIHLQIEEAVGRIIHERVEWSSLSRGAPGTTPVVLLDGFDELIQATGASRSDYLLQLADFQRRQIEWDQPVAILVTTRTLVSDRAEIPPGSLLVKLEDFDEDQIDIWLNAWNAANASTPEYRSLDRSTLARHADLARQPLLLTMLALYVADPDALDLSDKCLSQAQLYQRLLDVFVRREVRKLSSGKFSSHNEDLASRRRNLAITAFAMFNRGQLHVTGQQLEADFVALLDSDAEAFRPTAYHRAESLVGQFFFVHTSTADEHERTRRRRTYEFLHATFGEYLIAEHLLILMSEVSSDHARSLQALLSKDALAKRGPILEFARDLFSTTTQTGRENALGQLASLIRESRKPSQLGIRHESYIPARRDLLGQLAALMANLIVLRVALDPAPVPLLSLTPSGEEALPWWRSTVRLWHAGLDVEGWQSTVRFISITPEHQLIRRGAFSPVASNYRQPGGINVDPYIAEAELVVEPELESWLRTGKLATDTGRRRP